MNTLQVIGTEDIRLSYTDRPTVKVIIWRNNEILLLNEGLLPGGGIEPGETEEDAIQRELREELGMKIKETRETGKVIQYRNFLSRRYIIYGYTAEYAAEGDELHPQDEGEANFSPTWTTKEEGMKLVQASIERYKQMEMNGDDVQGKLYNLQTTLVFLEAAQL